MKKIGRCVSLCDLIIALKVVVGGGGQPRLRVIAHLYLLGVVFIIESKKVRQVCLLTCSGRIQIHKFPLYQLFFHIRCWIVDSLNVSSLDRVGSTRLLRGLFRVSELPQGALLIQASRVHDEAIIVNVDVGGSVNI